MDNWKVSAKTFRITQSTPRIIMATAGPPQHSMATQDVILLLEDMSATSRSTTASVIGVESNTLSIVGTPAYACTKEPGANIMRKCMLFCNNRTCLLARVDCTYIREGLCCALRAMLLQSPPESLFSTSKGNYSPLKMPLIAPLNA